MTEKLVFERNPKEGTPTLGAVFHVLLEKEIKEATGREALGYVVDVGSEDDGEDVNGLEEKVDTAEEQIDRLANFIMSEVPGEPSQSEGAVDCAIRIIRRAVEERKEIFPLEEFLIE